MKNIRFKRLWPLGAAAVFALVLLFAVGSRGAEQGIKYALSAPSFVGVASAAADNQAIETIQSEAGISAYFQSTTPVTISSVRSAFQTIELETTDYILGTVDIANFPENYNPHVYVHSDGWFMAYYFSTSPAAKIIDWAGYTASGDTNIPTNLEGVLTTVAGTAGVGLGDMYFYDFRFPNATTMMLIAERDNGGGSDYFTINIPTSFGVAERSWSYYNSGQGGISLNGTDLHYSYYSGYYRGTISAAQMPPASTHTIQVRKDSGDVGGIALVYTE